MLKLEEIEEQADAIADGASGTNYGHADRKLATMISALAAHLDDIRTSLDDVISIQLEQAGIDMKPAYERMRKMIEERTRQPL